VVVLYAYASWTVTHPFSWLPRSLSDKIGWVSGDSKPTVASDTKEGTPSTERDAQELRAKLLDYRGKLGDSFGPLNALLSSLGFIALLYSINLQRSVSAEQERLQLRQQFEALLSLTVQANREALREISLQDWIPDTPSGATELELAIQVSPYSLKAGPRWTGKEALRRLWLNAIEKPFADEVEQLMDNSLATEIAKQFKAWWDADDQAHDDGNYRMATAYVLLAFDSATWAERTDVFPCVARAYKKMYADNEFQLDAYFRTLYRIFELLSRGSDDYGLSTQQVREYAALARAQLSWNELAFVLLNCAVGDFEKAGRLYNFFALFDNLTTRNGFVTAVLRKFIEGAEVANEPVAGLERMSGLNTCAFSTDKARQKYEDVAS